jgi:hypothetical protein
MPVSSEFKGFWTPVFTGVTNSGTFASGSLSKAINSKFVCIQMDDASRFDI